MRQVIVAWSRSDAKAFEKQVPLFFLGERLRRLGSKAKFDVLFLEGIHLLDVAYREKLAALNLTLHDVESEYRRLEAAYAPLGRFGDYERKCFLRWLVVKEVFAGEPFVHYDGDIVFNALPEEIEAEMGGLTFTLHGCPAYARVGDASWLEAYRTELNGFMADIEAYSAKAWLERPRFPPGVRVSQEALWNRPILSSDQDLLQFLTISGRLPQAHTATLLAHTSMALFQNPLVIGDETALPLPLAYERRGGVDYIGGRKVAFWHMQSDFCDYLGYAEFCDRMGGSGRVRWMRGARSASYSAYRGWRRLTPRYARGPLVERYFGAGRDLSFLLNGRRFWRPGVFS